MLLHDSYLRFIIKHNLSQGQYLLLHLVYHSRGDLINDYKKTFPTDDGSMIGEYWVKDLITRGFLVENAKGNLEIGIKFKIAFIDKYVACDEIYAIYPTHFKKDGVHIPLGAMDRNVFANLYDIAIMSSIAEHLEVIEDIIYAMKHELLNIGIEKFVKSKYWLAIRPKRKENSIKERTVTSQDHEYDDE
jgi:hypothetical protein